VSQILIVEDDPAPRNSIRSILERNGDLVRTAGDGGASARELQTSSYDIVLLDIGLPFVDGWQILASRGPIQPASAGVSSRSKFVAA
jgi:DNA-binding response OmpR family regulator